MKNDITKKTTTKFTREENKNQWMRTKIKTDLKIFKTRIFIISKDESETFLPII